VTDLLLFAGDNAKDPRLRLQAIHMGIIQCSEEGRRGDAQCLALIVDQIEANANQPDLVAHIRMIFQADFGNVDLAREYAQTALALATKGGEPGWLTRARTNVAFFFRRIGSMDDAKALLQENWTFAIDHELYGPAAVTATRIAVNAVQDEDFTTARLWHDRAAQYLDLIDDKGNAGVLLFVKARIGLHDGDASAADEYLSTADSSSLSLNFRHRQTMAAIRCQVQLLRNEPIDRSQLDGMAMEFERYCDLGQHDFFALSLCKGLRSIGDLARAQSILSTYVTSRRRDRGPLPRSLGDEIQRLCAQS
jgi:hypothetical protein